MHPWWTYRLSDLLLFTRDTYYRMIALNNQAVWPVQMIALLLGVAMIVSILRRSRWQRRAVPVVLAAFWIWIAWAYHLRYFTPINRIKCFEELFTAFVSMIAETYPFDPGVAGDLKGRTKGHDLAAVVVIHRCLAVERSLPIVRNSRFGRYHALFDRGEKPGLQGDGGKMGVRGDDTLDGHYHRRVGQTDQCAAMHQPGSLGIVDQKRHAQHRPAVDGFDDLHVEQPLERRAAYPFRHLKLVGACGLLYFFAHVTCPMFVSGKPNEIPDVNNHMGSRISSSPEQMRRIFSILSSLRN